MREKENVVISIIIPAYNYGRYLAECLDSVIAQSFTGWECIIVDNGSTDDTATVAKRYAGTDARISYFFTEQKGVSYARNKGAELSSGRYLFPLDADDKIAAAYLEKALKVMEADASIKVVYSDAELFGALSGKWILPAYSLRDLLLENSIFCTALFRRSDFEAAGGFNENMQEGFEDWDFWIRMLKGGEKVFKIPEVLFYYRMRADSRNGTLDHEKQLMLRRRIFENNKAVYEQVFNVPDLIFDNYLLKIELAALKSSRDLRAGKALLKPIRFLKQLLNPKKR